MSLNPPTGATPEDRDFAVEVVRIASDPLLMHRLRTLIGTTLRTVPRPDVSELLLEACDETLAYGETRERATQFVVGALMFILAEEAGAQSRHATLVATFLRETLEAKRRLGISGGPLPAACTTAAIEAAAASIGVSREVAEAMLAEEFLEERDDG